MIYELVVLADLENGIDWTNRDKFIEKFENLKDYKNYIITIFSDDNLYLKKILTEFYESFGEIGEKLTQEQYNKISPLYNESNVVIHRIVNAERRSQGLKEILWEMPLVRSEKIDFIKDYFKRCSKKEYDEEKKYMYYKKEYIEIKISSDKLMPIVYKMLKSLNFEDSDSAPDTNKD